MVGHALFAHQRPGPCAGRTTEIRRWGRKRRGVVVTETWGGPNQQITEGVIRERKAQAHKTWDTLWAREEHSFGLMDSLTNRNEGPRLAAGGAIWRCAWCEGSRILIESQHAMRRCSRIRDGGRRVVAIAVVTQEHRQLRKEGRRRVTWFNKHQSHRNAIKGNGLKGTITHAHGGGCDEIAARGVTTL
jgi:hypothetical protein